MGDNPFSNTPFAAFGGQLAKAWQTGLETWWKALLSDRGRLTELAKHLEGLGHSPAGGASAGADDLAKVLEALELMQARTEKLEARVATVAETVEAMVGYLEQQSGETP
jgi:nanoRNase/pAp phosphatase (c-di-AMP/oligoRNAs hydrolase)